MNKYRVTFSKTLYTTIEVEARSVSVAIDAACEKFEPPTDETMCEHTAWDYDFWDDVKEEQQ